MATTISTKALAPIPSIIYGTAWKKEATQGLVAKALQTGFKAIDTACQPKHYNEPGVGKGIEQVLDEGWIKREDLWLQTKFTSIPGQDPNNIPYDENAELTQQVHQSISASLRNLKTSYIDALILHSPMHTHEDTLKVWKVFEEYVNKGIVRYIGISNCYDLNVFERLYSEATIKPSFIQNRFYHKSHFDVNLRAFCDKHDIKYQSFW